MINITCVYLTMCHIREYSRSYKLLTHTRACTCVKDDNIICVWRVPMSSHPHAMLICIFFKCV